MSLPGFYKRLAFAFTLASVLVCALAAATPVQAAPAIWEARDHDTRTNLFGLMHVLAPKMKWLNRAFDRA